MMLLKKVNGIISFLLISLFLFPRVLSAQTYYVDCNDNLASDSNPGTKELPWKTIHKANRAVGAGDTVIVRPGVYHDWIRPDSCGNMNNWIVYKSEVPHEAVLDGEVPLDSVVEEGSSWSRDLSRSGNIWKIPLISNAFEEAWMDGTTRLPYPFPYPCDSLEFSPGMSYVDSTGMLYVWLAEGDSATNHEWVVTLKSGVWLFPINEIARRKFVIVDGFEVKNYGLAGITVTLDYVKILNNISHDNGRGGVEVAFCNHVLVENNEAYRNCKGIGFAQAFSAYHVFGKDIYFRRNIAHDTFDGADPNHCGSDGNGFILDTCPPQGGAVFINNVAYRNMGGGFGVFQACNGYFINNTSFNNGQKSISTHECHVTGTSEYRSDSLVFRNNIFCGRTANMPVMKVQYAYVNPPQEVHFDHNLYFEPSADSSTRLFEVTIKNPKEPRTEYLTLQGIQALKFPTDTGNIPLHWEDSSLVGDPLFENWREGKFSLRKGSYAIDVGSSLLAPKTDYYGVARPKGAGYDIGAAEYVPESKVTNEGKNTAYSFDVYPNPFKSSTKFLIKLPQQDFVTISIYNILGQRVKTINKKVVGQEEYVWKRDDAFGNLVSSGIYFAVLKTNTSLIAQKIIILK